MKTFYSAADIEELAGQGVRELVVDDDTVLTSVARDAAAQLGVKLVAPGQRESGGGPLPAARAGTPLKPRGCQHGPIASGQGQAGTPGRAASGSANPVVDDLIGAVRQLAKRS